MILAILSSSEAIDWDKHPSCEVLPCWTNRYLRLHFTLGLIILGGNGNHGQLHQMGFASILARTS